MGHKKSNKNSTPKKVYDAYGLNQQLHNEILAALKHKRVDYIVLFHISEVITKGLGTEHGGHNRYQIKNKSKTSIYIRNMLTETSNFRKPTCAQRV